MKKKIFSILIYIITLFWMIVIFLFSSQTGDKSSGISMKIVNIIKNITYPSFDELSLTRQEQITNTLIIVVRKGAHMTEYAILCLLMFLSVRTIAKRYEPFIIAPAFCFLYALSDEFHQGFVGGRNMAFTDVLIDFLGAIIMLGIIYVFLLIRKHKKGEKYV